MPAKRSLLRYDAMLSIAIISSNDAYCSCLCSRHNVLVGLALFIDIRIYYVAHGVHGLEIIIMLQLSQAYSVKHYFFEILIH